MKLLIINNEKFKVEDAKLSYETEVIEAENNILTVVGGKDVDGYTYSVKYDKVTGMGNNSYKINVAKFL